MTMITVFKTSVQRKEEVKHLSTILDAIVMPHGEWNFDLEDCDKILRVKLGTTRVDEVVDALLSEGFHCEELSDELT